MRILKGYSKDEQKELECIKNLMSCNDLLHNITGNLADTESVLIRIKYYKADIDKRISIIKDILDFYTDKAKFTGSKKYYVHLIKGDEYSYLTISSDGGAELDDKFSFDGWRTKFTRDEVVAIDPRLVQFMEEVVN